MITLDIPQLSDEWFQARCGIPTASNFDKIITPRGAPSKQAQGYMYQLATERITGVKTETYQSEAMLKGIETEAEARANFAFIMDKEIKEVGICYLDDKKRFSCSPDGLLSDSGLEIKCPLSKTHVGYLLANTFPTDYIPQVQGSMLVTGFMSWWFMSYFPGLPPMIMRVERDTGYCAKLKVELDAFCEELDKVEAKLRGMA